MAEWRDGWVYRLVSIRDKIGDKRSWILSISASFLSPIGLWPDSEGYHSFKPSLLNRPAGVKEDKCDLPGASPMHDGHIWRTRSLCQKWTLWSALSWKHNQLNKMQFHTLRTFVQRSLVEENPSEIQYPLSSVDNKGFLFGNDSTISPRLLNFPLL